MNNKSLVFFKVFVRIEIEIASFFVCSSFFSAPLTSISSILLSFRCLLFVRLLRGYVVVRAGFQRFHAQ